MSARREENKITLFLAGDLMTGRGIDQILPHPSNPALHERYVKSALEYVALAERANGPIVRPVDFAYVWGDCLQELDRVAPDLRLINLETAVTTSVDCARKGINYRMNPDNAGVIAAAKVDGCVLANNHVLDWGLDGLTDTLATLRRIAVVPIGAGLTRSEAGNPAIFAVPGGRVFVFAFGVPTGGVPCAWAATDDRPGVNVAAELTPGAVDDLAARVAAVKQPGDIVVVSLHWGPNWGYDVAPEQSAFARGLIDRAGVDFVWGHSSHHPKAVEVHRGKPILYGCGDFIDDYEGISGYEAYRGDLVLMYFPTIALTDGALQRLEMVPLRICNFRLGPVSRTEAEWLRERLDRECQKVGAHISLDADNRLYLNWDSHPGPPSGRNGGPVVRDM
ncbi:MAG: CapA family protein [Hyphomicrobiales bacterium]|nr:CapA family protein [Hyphomicrobiales bacterium]